MKKLMQVKRNHHYVWSFYLKSWTKDNDIFYISKKGKISCDSVRGLAREADFYKITPLKQEDINFIKRFSSMSPQFLQNIHMSHLDDFIKMSFILSLIRKSKNNPKELEQVEQVIKHNSLENMHSIYEDSAVAVVSRLAGGDRSAIDYKENMLAFCSYLGHQISRTKAFKEKSLDAIRSNPHRAKTYSDYLLLMERNWWFISFMFGLSIGLSLFESKDRDNHIFISNETDLPFITSDDPIVNVHKELESLPDGVPPENADFFIPLSPKYAYMINKSNDFNHLKKSISREEVRFFNNTMFKKSYKTVFGSTRSVLSELKSHRKGMHPARG